MSEVAEIKRQRLKNTFTKEGLDFNNLRICFNAYQFKEAMQKILNSPKRLDDVLNENKDLYTVGYYMKQTGKVYLINKFLS